MINIPNSLPTTYNLRQQSRSDSRNICAKARGPIRLLTPLLNLQHAPMAAENRYQVLADSIYEDDEEASEQPQSSQEGDEIKITVDDEEYGVYTDVRDGDRRRKVSQDQHEEGIESNSPISPCALLPTHTSRKGLGRGGGIHNTQNTAMGSLSTITEGIEEANIKDSERLYSETELPSTEPPEKSTTIFTIRAQLTWGLDPGPQVNHPCSENG